MPASSKSTSVRALTAVLAGLERVAPHLGARVVERVWFTLPARRRANGQLPPGGAPFEVTVGGRAVRGNRWGNGDQIVYLIHGWGGSATQFGAFVEPLVAAGFSVVTYDALSHGDSDPGPSGRRRSTVLEHLDVLRAVVAANGPAHGTVAHSLGSMAAALALREGIVPQRAVAVAPMTDAASYTRWFTDALGAGPRTWARFVDRLERRFALPLSYFDITGIADQVTTPPLLVIHDRDDQETSWEASGTLAHHWPDARLLTTRGLGHNRILADPDVVAVTVAFLRGLDDAVDEVSATTTA